MYFKSYLGRRAVSYWALAHISSFFNQTQDLRAPSKILHMLVYNFGGSGRNLTIFYQRMSLTAGVIKWTLILQGVLSTKFGRVKTSKIQRIFNNFRVWSQISQEWIDVSKIRKVLDQLHSIPYWAKKFGELWSTNNKVIDAHVDPPNWIFFGILNFGP